MYTTTSLLRAGTALIARENTIARRLNHARLGRREKFQRHFDIARRLGSLYVHRLAGQRVDQQAAHALRGQRDKFAASHASLPGFFR
jgi:hypothetical protein